MKIGDYKQMMAYLTRPEQPKEQVADLVDDLTPGPLKDELTKDYDPSQESYEEYLQRKALGERPFNAQDGGRANLYAGGSLEKFGLQIKDLHLNLRNLLMAHRVCADYQENFKKKLQKMIERLHNFNINLRSNMNFLSI